MRALYPENDFGGYSRRDGTVAFYLRVNALLRADSRVLDYGCGTAAHYLAEDPFTQSLQRLRGKVTEVIGADIDPVAQANPLIDRFVEVRTDIPIAGESVDLCISDWGVEHFDDPVRTMRELHRVLVPGGTLCVRTPNSLHYSSVGARLLPHRLHAGVRRWLGQFHSEEDVFPVFYRANTRRSLAHALRRAGFGQVVVLRHRGESHLRDAGTAWAWAGELIERLAPAPLWHELHAFARR